MQMTGWMLLDSLALPHNGAVVELNLQTLYQHGHSEGDPAPTSL